MGKIYDIGPRQTFTPLNTGDYVLTLKEVGERVEEQDSQYSKKGDVKVEWTWEVEVPGEEPTTRRSRAAPPASWNEKSVFVHIAEALRLVDHERAVTEGAHINWDVAIGRQCIGSILKAPKEGKPGEWTDNIRAFAPMPETPAASNGTKAPSAGLLKRLADLAAFAGTDDTKFNGDGASSYTVASHLSMLGKQPMTDTAWKNLGEMRSLLVEMGGDFTEELPKDATLKDGLLYIEKLQKTMEAL